MSILRQHFEARAKAEAARETLGWNVYFDVYGTLVHRDRNKQDVYHPNQEWVDFARWNHETKLLGSNHIFSRNVEEAVAMLASANINIADISDTALQDKESVYYDALRTGKKLGLVVDDQPLWHLPGNRPTKNLAITVWIAVIAPYRQFADTKAYLNFRP
jgi:hypothetical protein